MDLGIVLATNHHKYNHMSHNILTLSTYQQRIASLHPNINLQTIEIIRYYIHFWETDLTSTCDKYLAVVNLWPRSVITCACQRSGSVGHNTHKYSHGSTHKYSQVYDTHAHPYNTVTLSVSTDEKVFKL